MGIPLTGYRTARLLRSSGHARVYEAVRESDGLAVVAKVFDMEDDDVEPRVEHEFALIEALDIDGVVKALALERVGDQLVLLLERVAGQDLAEYCKHEPLDLDRFFSIALQIVTVLERIHDRRVIHRDIKPTNILIEPDTGRVCLADFGISVLLDAERRHIYDPAVLEGTLPYISPEQTGRTGRGVDFRSDLYSLGVTFYELLTGHRPFEFDAPLELIHAHLARRPAPPDTLRAELPDGLSRLVIKLLEKAPEHRYQTAAGLAVDLRKIRELIELGQDGRGLLLGREDFPRSLQLPHQLYGRAQERHELVDELERVSRRGSGQVMLLTGPPGVGKSALLADFEGPATGLGAHLARGKFDGFRELPYSGFVDAFAGLVDQLLTEREELLERWRGRLVEALGGVAGVVCELVPGLALIIGEQEAPQELEPHEARNRLHLALTRFVLAFCGKDQPLVLVLDDLHWADRGSLVLLEALIEAGRRRPMLILASYREELLDAGDPLSALIESLVDAHRARITRLRELSDGALEELLADTLSRSSAELTSLARIVGRKTNNNPLFVRQLLTALAERGLLRPGERGWSWDEQAIEAASIPDDVVEVMTAKLAGLAEDQRDLLARAACIGQRFELAALERVSLTPRAALASTLYALVELGLLAVVGRGYQFAHDQIRDVARDHLPADERARLHWRLGERALEREGELADDELFEIVDHLDAGLACVIDGPEFDDARRLELAGLNLRAGARALDAAAYDIARRYLDVGAELVASEREAVAIRGPDASHYDLVVGLEFSRAQVQCLAGEAEAASATFDGLLGWRLDIERYAHVAARRVRLLALEGQPSQAVEIGLGALARCGYRLSPKPGKLETAVALLRGWLLMRGRDFDELLALPPCEEPEVQAAMEILSAVKPAAYVTDSNLLMLLVGLHVRLFLRHGFHPTCANALAQLAIGVGPGLRRVEDAVRLCEQSLALLERTPSRSSRALVESATYLFVWHLGRPFAETFAQLDGAYNRALETGDFESAAFIGALGLSMRFDVGTHLRTLERLSRRLEQDIERWGAKEMVLVAWMVRGVTVKLLGGEQDAESAISEDSDVHTALDPEVVEARGGSRVSVYAARANEAIVALILGDATRALSLCLDLMDGIEEVMFGSWMIPRTALTCVVAAARELEAAGSISPRVHALARASRRIIARWSRDCPANYAHYRDLAEGLRASTRGRVQAAMAMLERARVHAHAHACRWVEGLAAEELASLAEREGLAAFAKGARGGAYEAYAAWGAEAKLAQLREAYPEQFESPARADTADASASRSSRRRSSARPSSAFVSRAHSSTTNPQALDFESVLQAVSAMAEDLDLGEVVSRVLDAAITNAGADRGALLLERDGVLGVVARSEVGGDAQVFEPATPIAEAEQLCPTSLVNFVVRTNQALVIDDARTDPRFSGDPYVVRTAVQSLLAMPIQKGKRQLGAVVLENRLSAYCFTPERLESLNLIAGQAASALDNARLYAALSRSEARWRSLVDGAPDVIALLNERGEVEFVNRSSLYGSGSASASTSAGSRRLLETFMSADSAQSWREALTAVLREGAQRELEVEVVRGTEGPRWYVARLAPIEVDGGGTRAAVAVATDITERRQADLERAALEAQLRQQQRLESVGTLASGVAHEINNPVQGILNYAELIQENLGEQGLVHEFAEEITGESKRVATIVRNLLQFSRQEQEARTEHAEPRELVEATLSLIRAVLRRDQIELVIEVPADLPKVHCRVQQIQQIIMNLVTNARDALNELYPGYDARKRVVIRAGVHQRGGSSWMRITVEDHGPGIPRDVLPRIFDPFFTTKGRDQGTGLGLSVSHGIASDHGGELGVETKAGRGTSFHLDLPLDSGSTGRARPGSRGDQGQDQ